MQRANAIVKSFGKIFSIDTEKQFCYISVDVSDLKLQQALQFVCCLFVVLPVVRGGRVRGIGYQLKQKRFWLGLRRELFTVKAVMW